MHKAILLFPLALAACGGSPSSSGPAMVSLRAAGASFTATMGAGPKTCAFSDALMPGETTFQGTVTVEQSSTGDAGSGNPYGP